MPVAATVLRPNNNAPSYWILKCDDRLRELWVLGITCKEIADVLNEEFGTHFTKNAIIGRSKRLKLENRREARPRRTTPIIKTKVRSSRRNPQRLPRIKIVTDTASDLQTPLAQRKSIYSVGECDCRWPVGDPKSPNFFLCGAPVADDRPYCPQHCARAYRVEDHHG